MKHSVTITLRELGFMVVDINTNNYKLPMLCNRVSYCLHLHPEDGSRIFLWIVGIWPQH